MAFKMKGWGGKQGAPSMKSPFYKKEAEETISLDTKRVESVGPKSKEVQALPEREVVKSKKDLKSKKKADKKAKREEKREGRQQRCGKRCKKLNIKPRRNRCW